MAGGGGVGSDVVGVVVYFICDCAIGVVGG